MKVLLIARTYPPQVGGIERFAERFQAHLSLIFDVTLHSNPGGKKTLLPYIYKLFFFLLKHHQEYDIIHFCDGVLSPFIGLIKLVSKAKISMTVHGLDIVYAKWGYQIWNSFFLRLADLVIPVSRYTYDECIKRGVNKEKLTIIHNGIDFASLNNKFSTNPIEYLQKFEIDPPNNKLLMTVGRLIKRKGHTWFIENVFSKLDNSYRYLIVGDGPEHFNIQDCIQKNNLGGRVILTGYISDEKKYSLYSVADFFIMPNISVQDDQEGFGIVILEAGGFSLPVIATDIEGIHDAVLDGISGRLIKEKDAYEFLDAIQKDDIDRRQILPAIQQHFSWDAKIKEYRDAFLRISPDQQ